MTYSQINHPKGWGFNLNELKYHSGKHSHDVFVRLITLGVNRFNKGRCLASCLTCGETYAVDSDGFIDDYSQAELEEFVDYYHTFSNNPELHLFVGMLKNSLFEKTKGGGNADSSHA